MRPRGPAVRSTGCCSSRPSRVRHRRRVRATISRLSTRLMPSRRHRVMDATAAGTPHGIDAARLRHSRARRASSSSVSDGRIWATHALSRRHLPDAADYSADVSGLLAMPLSQRPARLPVLLSQGARSSTLELGRQSGKILRDRAARRPADPAQELRDLEGDGSKSGRALDATPTARSPRRPASRWSRSCCATTRSSPTSAAKRRRAPAHAERGAQPPGQEHSRGHQVARRSPDARRDATLADYVASLKGRIQALALAHDQIARGDDGGSSARPARRGPHTVPRSGVRDRA